MTNRQPHNLVAEFGSRGMNAIRDGMALADMRLPEQPLIAVNSAFEELTAYASERILGNNCRFLQGRRTDAGKVAEISRSIRCGEPFEGELLNYRKDGSTFWNSLRLTPIFDDDGVLTHYIGVQRDVSLRRRQDREAQQLRYEIARLERSASLSALSACIGHEVNQPLASIVNNARAAQRLLKLGLVDDVAEALEDIAGEGLRAGKIIDRLRRLSQNREPARAPTDIGELTIESLKLVGSDLVENSVALTVDSGGTTVILDCDAIELTQVILNIARNAIDALQACPTDRRRLDVSLASSRSEVVLTFRDSGPGANDEVLAHMFDSYFTSKPGGTGVGLLVSRSIAEAHGGSLDAARNADAGLTFTLRLPRDR